MHSSSHAHYLIKKPPLVKFPIPSPLGGILLENPDQGHIQGFFDILLATQQVVTSDGHLID